MESKARQSEFEQSHERLSREYPADPKIVYLASAYRSARGEYGVTEHINAALPVARAIWKLGLACICPVLNTAHFGGCDVPDEVWLAGDFAILRRLDAIVMHENSEASEGAQQELKVARNEGLPVFYLPKDWRLLAAWAKRDDIIRTCKDVEPRQPEPVGST